MLLLALALLALALLALALLSLALLALAMALVRFLMFSQLFGRVQGLAALFAAKVLGLRLLAF